MGSTSINIGGFSLPKTNNWDPCKNSLLYYMSGQCGKKQTPTASRGQQAAQNAQKAQSVAAQTAGSNTKTSNGNGNMSYQDAGNAVVMNADGTVAGVDGTGTGTGTGIGGSGGATSPLLSGDMTFEELVGEICNGLDLLFLVKRSTVVVTDYETIYAEAKYLRDNYNYSVESENINLWQLEEGSYEFEVNEYGFYNTVIVKYKDGEVKESYTDYVRVYGEVPITYEEPKADKTTAIMKAKAYLAAHIREFDMTVRGTVLHDGEIDIGDIITLDNPLTLRDDIHRVDKEDPEFLFVIANSISWDGEGYITNDIEMRYGPESPEKKEVPETGASYSKGSGNADSAIAEIGQLYSGIAYSHACQTADCVKQTGGGDCWGMSDLLACELQSRGVNAKIVQYDSGVVGNHRSVLYQTSNGTWQDFPYRQYGFNTLFNNTAGSASGTEVSKSCG